MNYSLIFYNYCSIISTYIIIKGATMKLVRYGNYGSEKPGIVDNENKIRSINHIIGDINPANLSELNFQEQCKHLIVEDCPIVGGVNQFRFGSPITNVNRLISVGLNSRSDIIPEDIQDLSFLNKAVGSLVGPNDSIVYSKNAKQLDCGALLAIIIGKKCKDVKQEEAMQYVLGFSCFNNVSDTVGPLGPYITTLDEIDDLSTLHIKIWINGKLRRDYFSSEYGHSPAEVIAYLSKRFMLYPGDVIVMGGRQDIAAKLVGHEFLKPYDKISLQIEKLGMQQHTIVGENELECID